MPQVHTYEVHSRFGDLRATSNLSRLQLAALYAATSSLVPEPLSRMTGVQMASALLRQCWKNSPLSPDEALQVECISSLGGHLSPCLRLQAHELRLSAAQLSHLHVGPTSSTSGCPLGERPLVSDAAIDYLHGKLGAVSFQGWCHNPRAMLSRDEEVRAMAGTRRPLTVAPPAWFRSGIHRRTEVPDCPVADTWVAKIESQIITSCIMLTPSRMSTPALPIKESPRALPLETEMLEELERSWEAWHSAPVASLPAGLTDAQLRNKLQAWKVCCSRCCIKRVMSLEAK